MTPKIMFAKSPLQNRLLQNSLQPLPRGDARFTVFHIKISFTFMQL